MPGFLIPQTSASPLTITDVFVVNSEAAMLALSSAQTGDVAIRTDINKTFILSDYNYGTLSSWKEVLAPLDAVSSVDGQTGSVSLSNTYQAKDGDLTALAALSGTGFVKRTGADTYTLDTNTYLTANQTITVSGDLSGSGTTSLNLTLGNSGVAANTYGSSTAIPVITVDAKGRITSASTSTVQGLPSQTGNSGKYLTTDGTNASWATINLSAYALTSGTLSQFASTTSSQLAGVISDETGSGSLVFATSPTISTPIILSPEERCNIVASAATGTIGIDVLTSTVWYYSSNASANHTINIRGNSGTTLNSILSTGDSITVVWLINNGTTAYYPTTIQIDGSSITPNWINGSAPPTAAQANQTAGLDAFTFTIIKTAATPTYRVLGAWSQYR